MEIFYKSQCVATPYLLIVKSTEYARITWITLYILMFVWAAHNWNQTILFNKYTDVPGTKIFVYRAVRYNIVII